MAKLEKVGEEDVTVYEDNRSLLSRFSGFFLFIIALAVVGVLVFLTVRSASDDNGDGNLAVTSSEPIQADGEVTISDPSPAVNLDSTDVVVSDQADDSEGVVIADDDATGLTSTNNDDAAATNDDTASSSGVVASAADSSLPSTGAGELFMATFSVVMLSVFVRNYFSSKRSISKSILS